MKKTVRVLCLLTFLALFCVGCGKKTKDNKSEITAIPTPVEGKDNKIEENEEQEKQEVTIPEGKAQSLLTGELVDEELVNTRPYAIMFNNIKYASPQSGLSEAAIVYEAIVEGGITRLMGIFEDLYDKEGKLIDRIGSARSARHYYVSFADEYDAIYVHFGETKYATKKISDLGIDTLSGLTGIGNTVFYRDKSIKAPHNAFASGEGILAGTKAKGYRTEYKKDFKGHYKFNLEDTDLDSTNKAKKITLGYSSYTSPYFEYNKKKKEYARYQFGTEHTDYNTKEQLTYKNIIVQFVKEYNIDKNGYQTMDIENNSGSGYYITNGKWVPISWEKNEAKKEMTYYNQAGEELILNPGKTFISIFPISRSEQVKFE